MKTIKLDTVTVVGANGTMGRNVSAIFASFGKAKVYMVSRTIEKSEIAKEKAYQSVHAESIKDNLIPVDDTMLEPCIIESDLVFESVSESWSIKESITKQIAEIVKKHLPQCKDTVFCTGTSGLSITKLSELYPEEVQGNYMGMHMFNPPYTMTLCEMIPTVHTNRELFQKSMRYCKERLYRTVVEVKDSPAFLGNRIGFQFINQALQCAEEYKYNGGIDYIDAILGPFTGRTMKPLVTSDFVGLDVHKAIVDNLYINTDDFAHKTFIFPEFAETLLLEEKLGKKTGGGLYKTVLHDSGVTIHQVYDVESNRYRNRMNYTFPFVEAMLENLKVGEYKKAFHILKNNYSTEAELCCKFLLHYILYALKATKLVGYKISAADDVMAAGFHWCPPLAMIQALGGVEEFFNLCLDRIEETAVSHSELTNLIKGVRPSTYDYRKYIKAIK